MIYFNNTIVGNVQDVVDTTENRFVQVPAADRSVSSEKFFIFRESGRSIWNKLKKTADKAGYPGYIMDMGDGTLIGALNMLYTRMGHMSFTINQDDSVTVEYDNTVPSVTPHTKPQNPTALQENTYWNTVLGNVETINQLGYNFKSMTEALKYIFMLLHNLGVSINANLNTVTFTDYTEQAS